MSHRTDLLVLLLLTALVLMLGAALTGVYQVFGYALVGAIGVTAALGFVRTGVPASWVPPVMATVVLLGSFTGMFQFEHLTVASPDDTWWGFQPGTAFLIYGVWIPAFFTLALGYALVFDRISAGEAPGAGAGDRHE